MLVVILFGFGDKFATPAINLWYTYGHLPVGVLFIDSNLQFLFGPLNFIFKFEEDPISVC